MKKTLCVLGLLLTMLQGAWCWSGSGTSATDPILIESDADWQKLGTEVSGGSNYSSGKYFKLAVDITVSTSVGSTEGNKRFMGTFDGGGHTLTLNIESTSRYAAPFSATEGATIRNLTVGGTLTSSAQYAGGLVGWNRAANTLIEDVTVTATLESTINGDATMGGFVGVVSTANVTLNRCVFHGHIAGNNAHSIGGFIGWVAHADSPSASATLTNCVFAPAGSLTVDNTNCSTLARKPSEAVVTITDCYYSKALGTAQGTELTTTLSGLQKKVYSGKFDGSDVVTDLYASTKATLSGLSENYQLPTAATVLDALVVSYGDATLTKGTDYTVTLTRQGSATALTAFDGAGLYTVTVTGAGSYAGTATTTVDMLADLTAGGTRDGSAEKPFLIGSDADWHSFVCQINKNEDYEDKYLQLTADVSTTEIAGSRYASNYFRGTLDGQGHTLTVNIGTAEAPVEGTYIGPFYDVENANFKNLNIAGHIYTSGQFVGGLVGRYKNHYESTTFTNLRSTVAIHSTYSGSQSDSGIGGFIGYAWTSDSYKDLTFDGCRFTGSLSGSTVKKWGGFIGRRETSSVSFENCLFAPTAVDVDATGSATFAPNTDVGTLPTNTAFYTQAMGTAQGKQVYTTREGDGLCQTVTFDGTTYYTRPTVSINAIDDLTYTGSALKAPAPTVIYDGHQLYSGSFAVSYTLGGEAVAADAIVNPGTYTLTITGKNGFTGTATTTFRVLPADIGSAAVTLSGIGTLQDYQAGGYSATPVVAIQKDTLTLGTDYTVSWTGPTEGTGVPVRIEAVGRYTITISGTGHYSGTKTIEAEIVGLLNGEGTETSPYLISTVADWRLFADRVNRGLSDGFIGKYVRLENDLTLTEADGMVGLRNGERKYRFCGAFLGNGKTLTISYGSAAAPLTDDYAAPFRSVHHPGLGYYYMNVPITVRDLTVRGDIYTSAKFAAGIVASAIDSSDGVLLTNCHSVVNIHSSVNGDGTHGGLVAYMNIKNSLSPQLFSECTFTGSMTGEHTTNCGGFVGWVENEKQYYGNVEFNNCLFAPTAITLGDGCKTLARMRWTTHSDGSSGLRTDNAYYTQPLGDAQGTQVYATVPDGKTYTTVTAADGHTYYIAAEVTGLKETYQNLSDTVNLGYSVKNAAGKTIADSLYTVTIKDSQDNIVEAVKASGNYTLTLTMAAPGQGTADYAFSITPVWQGEGSTARPFLIQTADDWATLDSCVCAGQGFSGTTFALAGDLTVTTMVSSSLKKNTNDAYFTGHPFKGIFDGDGHTLTVSYGTADAPLAVKAVAPFRYVQGATFRNLHIAGDIYVSDQFAGGLVGYVDWQGATINFTNCRSSVNIHSTVEGDGTHGGYIGLIKDQSAYSTVIPTFTGCVFDGSFLASQTTNCGGFIGWIENGGASRAKFTDCLFTPADIQLSSLDGSQSFARTLSDRYGKIDITNSYYTTSMGGTKGAQTYRVTTDDTEILVGGSVDDQKTYDVAGLKTYLEGGLAYRQGDNDWLDLRPDGGTIQVAFAGSIPGGYDLSFTATGGAEVVKAPNVGEQDKPEGAWCLGILTVNGADAVVSKTYTASDWTQYNAGTADDPYLIYNKEQLQLLADRVNAAEGANNYSDKVFRQMADLVYEDNGTDNNYTPVGYFFGNLSEQQRVFSGTYDGNGHSIKGVRYRRPANSEWALQQSAGIFGNVGGTVRNLWIDDCHFTAYRNVGAIAGKTASGSLIENCHVGSGVTVHAGDYESVWDASTERNTGGVVGSNFGNIFGCTSAAAVMMDGTTAMYIGGIAGYSADLIKGCLYYGDTVKGSENVGAIVGSTTYAPQNNFYIYTGHTGRGDAGGDAGCTRAVATDSAPADLGDAVEGLTYSNEAYPGVTVYPKVLLYNGIYYMTPSSDFVLSNSTDNTELIDQYRGLQVNATLADRTFKNNNTWYTLCLPFKLSEQYIKEHDKMKDAEIMILDLSKENQNSFDETTGTLTLDFIESDEISAGWPYLVRWPGDGSQEFELTFEGVTIVPGTEDRVAANAKIAMKGSYAPVTFPAGKANRSVLYMGSNNKLYWPDGTRAVTVGCQRAYFQLDGLVMADGQTSKGVRAIALRFDEGEATGIEGVYEVREVNDNSFYDLQGRRVENPRKGGLYIVGGKKVVY